MKKLLVVLLLFISNLAVAHTDDCKVVEYELKSYYYELKVKIEKGQITLEEAQKMYSKRRQKVKKGTC